MKQQVILNIHGISTQVEIRYAPRNMHVFHYCFGEICARITKNRSLDDLAKTLENCFKRETILALNSEPLLIEDYAYVLGNVVEIKKRGSAPLSRSNAYITLEDHTKISLKNYLYNIIINRVRYYEKVMGLAEHEVHIKDLFATLGNNHYTKKVLNFNERLIHFSLELIDSVVVHELCHDIYHNHGPNFYNMVYQYCSDYDLKRKKLVYGVKR